MTQSFLRSVDNALRILEFFSENGSELGVSEIGKRLGLGKSTVYRLLTTLEKRGFVEQNLAKGKYRLGMKIVHMGAGILQQLNIIKESRPYIEELSRRTGESVHLALYSRGEITFVDKVTGSNPAKMGSLVGLRKPAYCTATGKVLLAHLPESELQEYLAAVVLEKYTPNTIENVEELRRQLMQIRSLGYAEDQQESEEGLVCFAAPIRNAAGKVVAAVSVSGAASRLNAGKQKLIVMVKETAEMISRASGFSTGYRWS